MRSKMSYKDSPNIFFCLFSYNSRMAWDIAIKFSVFTYVTFQVTQMLSLDSQ